jgi:hypothetical protein
MTITFRRAVAIFLLLASAYLITYTGRIELGDQLEYFDAVGGVARFGQPLADEASWQTPPSGSSLRNDPPLRATIAEPLFIYAAAPVYFAAERMSGVGMLHAVWLFNIAISPLVAVLTYALALRVGISVRGAVFAALAFGLLTIWWTYSQTFFREPMMMALLLLAAMALWDVPRAPTGRRRILAAVTAAAMLVLALLTKEAVVFALPGLAVLALPPSWWEHRAFRRLALAAMIVVAAVMLILIYTPLLDWLAAQLPGGYLFTPAFEILPETTRVALHTYTLSLGGSLWGTSPVLLLAIPGAWLLWRRQPAYVTAALLVAAGYAVGYALLRGEGSAGGNWFGGTIWPMRFLLPALPFAVILTAPAVEAAKSRWARIAVVLICLYSLWWQLSSVVFNWAAYDIVSADYSFGLTYWLPGFNVLEHLRPVALLRAIGTQPVNFAWARADILPYALLFAIPLAVSALVLRAGGRKAWAGLAVSVVMLAALTYGGLRLLHDRDPLYMPGRDDLRQAAGLIRETVPVGGIVLVNDPETTWFWLNHGKVGRRWIVGLGYHPGDRGSFEQPVLVESENAAEEIASGAPRLIQRLAESRGRMWLFMDASSELPWARRPLERFMGERYYRIEDRYISPYARLLSYDTAPAPAWDEPAVPQVESPFTFTDPDTGDELRLLGYMLPEGQTLRPGRPLPVSLVWEADVAPSRDYTAALFVVRADDPFVRVQGADSWLGATFRTTSLMPPDEAIWDHRAVMIPADWQAGEYRLWLKLYYNDYNTGRITDMVASGGAIVEGDIAVLSGGIRVE